MSTDGIMYWLQLDNVIDVKKMLKLPSAPQTVILFPSQYKWSWKSLWKISSSVQNDRSIGKTRPVVWPFQELPYGSINHDKALGLPAWASVKWHKIQGFLWQCVSRQKCVGKRTAHSSPLIVTHVCPLPSTGGKYTGFHKVKEQKKLKSPNLLTLKVEAALERRERRIGKKESMLLEFNY